jgi:hypothetical protein
LTEAWGHFTGGIVVADWAASNARIRESQIRFMVSGHDHSGAATLGAVLSTTGMHKRFFNLNDCRIAWGDLWHDRIFSTYPYALVGGTAYLPFVTYNSTSDILYGTRLIDFNPFAATAPDTLCQLDLRSRGIYDTNAGIFNTNWELIGAVAFVNGPPTTAPRNDVFRIDWVDVTAPYFVVAAYDYATTGGSVLVDYLAIIKRL